MDPILDNEKELKKNLPWLKVDVLERSNKRHLRYAVKSTRAYVLWRKFHAFKHLNCRFSTAAVCYYHVQIAEV